MVQAKTKQEFSIWINPVLEEIIEASHGEFILDFTGFRNRLYALKRKAGIEFQLRDLRRTAATMVAKEGVELEAIRSLLGHTSTSMTEVYIQASDKQIQKAGEILGEKFRKRAIIPLAKVS